MQMNWEIIESLRSEFQNSLFLYPWEIFELRIQEEMIRADRSNSCFSYLEIPFDLLRPMIKPQVDDRTLWHMTFQFLTETMRGSDLKGLLSENKGIGLVSLDCGIQGALESRSRYWMRLKGLSWLIEECLQKGIESLRATQYPLEVTP
ncbi:MAG TPA: hypothetical protein VLM37_07960 [Fibrobacteraceae bacterium]|nr:hypothetical protein [Fibrobacteraceae bacterium]